ncbi:glycoside hydrolase family 43 protein [Bifidobacterium sp. ESL0800]|uniref:glycoside hydrolase family 43 protein n=1 Tax=Bifidobacterium sp. ESL0800 TaxID=2983236 RepID=UPI0023F78731|nr:glycoside hydrolase family 43 protein [Bifidobacterium sp. ESL0800]WEV76527.1 glycoside hydrolase family 43 protein [Bifidobacterium sp. ESL0800]
MTEDTAVLGDPYGYLLVHFREDPDGYAERIYFDLSRGDDPTHWIPLNGGEPILTSGIGTTGVRDPHVIRNPETSKYYIIATDLRVFGGRPEDGANWYDWSHHGSTSLIIWESDDLVHWRGPRPLDVSRPLHYAAEGEYGRGCFGGNGSVDADDRRDDDNVGFGENGDGIDGSDANVRESAGRNGNGRKSADVATSDCLELGMAWACECLWVPDYYPETHAGGRGAFVMYWSSKIFGPDDPEHRAEDVHDTVLWGATTDFTQDTFEFGGRFIDTGGDSIDTTMIQRVQPNGGLRTYRITKDNTFGRGIWMDATDARRWWRPGTAWRTIQTNIGDNYDAGNGEEGPAVFADHTLGSDRWYLLVDVIPSTGYRPMVSDDLEQGWKPLDAADFSLSAHTKHGGVLSLDRSAYERLRAALWR